MADAAYWLIPVVAGMILSFATALHVHGEFNRAQSPLRLFQIWIEPNRLGAPPFYSTRRFPERESGRLTVLASGLADDASSDALPLRASARLLAGRFESGQTLRYDIATGRDLYLVPSTGSAH